MESLHIMYHEPSKVKLASERFEGYLTNEELTERQTSGRFWDIEVAANFALLYIIIDDDTFVRVTDADNNDDNDEDIGNPRVSLLPMSLRLRLPNVKYK